MLPDERNFRSTYYEKVGCRSVEEKKSLEILLKDKPLNRIKLKQFCLSFSVPHVHRGLLWNLLLGVSPVYPDSHAYVMTQRLSVFQDLQDVLKILRVIDENTPKPKIFHAMWMLENKMLKSNFNVNNESNFISITEVLLNISENDVEVYWIAKGFYKFALEIAYDFHKLRELSFNLLEKKDILLFRHLENNNMLYDLPLEKWYTCCFAGIITKPALIRIWDKICGGSRKIIVFVFLVLCNTLSRKIMAHNNSKDVLKQIDAIKDNLEICEQIVTTAIALWQQNTEHSEIMIHRKDN